MKTVLVIMGTVFLVMVFLSYSNGMTLSGVLAVLVSELATQWRLSGLLSFLILSGFLFQFTPFGVLFRYTYFIALGIALCLTLYARYELLPKLIQNAERYQDIPYASMEEMPFMLKVRRILELERE